MVRRALAVALLALVFAATANAKVTPFRRHETPIFCGVVLPQIAGPTVHVRLCHFVRYDNLATEDLFRVWFTHRGATYTVCLWSGLDSETYPERVPHVGDIGRTLC